MILLYHKIDVENKTIWWVSANAFYRQMVQLRDKKVVYLDEYDPKNPDHVVITFDGIYRGVLRYALPILKKFGYPFELFITSDYIGKENLFDDPEPAAPFTNEKELQELVAGGGRIQWHTKTHADLTALSDADLKKELLAPAKLKKLDPKGFKWFAYPYGRYDDRSQKLVAENYTGGLACDNGTYKDKTIWPRTIIYEETRLRKEKVSVIVPSHNYAHYLVEAIDSLLAQTYLPDEILLSDDASTDHSFAIMKTYQEKYPNLIKVNQNEHNLGIEKHFNKAIKLTSGDFVCFLGADNRIPGTYIENCVTTLLQSKRSAIAYTDFALFGNRAKFMYEKFDKEYQGEQLDLGVFLIHFPEFTPKSKKYLLGTGNFIHGSSMFRRVAFDKVGGYDTRTDQHEDYALFQKIIKAGWNASKVADTYLEYRQHSPDQANQQFNYFAELSFLRLQYQSQQQQMEATAIHVRNLEQQLAAAAARVEVLEQDLHTIRTSTFWKLRYPYLAATGMVRHPRSTYRKIKNKVKGRVSRKRQG